MAFELKEKTHFIFDLDGTLYAGTRVIPFAAEALTLLRENGRNVRFLSNNSNQSCEEIAQKLGRMGITALPWEIVTPLRAAGAFLQERYGASRVYVIGSDALCGAVRDSGHELVQENPQVVLVGRDLSFSFEKLQRAGQFLQSGAVLVATNADLVHPGENGYAVPETGALVAALEAVCTQKARYIGKPEGYLFKRLLEQERIIPRQAVMIGDNHDTDIQGSFHSGVDAVWLDSLRQPSRQSDRVLRLHSMEQLYLHLQEDLQ